MTERWIVEAVVSSGGEADRLADELLDRVIQVQVYQDTD